MPLGSQYLLLVLYNVQENKMLFKFTCWIEYFIEDTQYFVLCSVYLVECTPSPNSMIEIEPELWP